MEIEEGSRWWEFLWKNEMLERDGKPCFRLEPTIRYYRDIIVGRYRFEHGDGKCQVVFVLCVALTENECIVEQDYFAIDVFDNNPERLRSSMDLLVPLEIRDDSEIDSK